MVLGISIEALMLYSVLGAFLGIFIGVLSILYHKGYNTHKIVISIITFFIMSIASMLSDIALATKNSRVEHGLKRIRRFFIELKKIFFGNFTRFPESLFRISEQVANSNSKHKVLTIAVDKVKRHRID